MLDHQDTHGLAATEIEALAQKALAALPEPFRTLLADVPIRIEEFARAETLNLLNIKDVWELTGLYEGRPLTEQSIWGSGELPPVITFYRQPLLREQRETQVPIADLIRHVLIHEGGHHFGLSDHDMEELECTPD